jgi:RNA polymerase sigma factor (sigma-70 family)
MQTISENTLLEQLRNEDNASFEILYKFYFPSIEHHITQNHGCTEDAEDIFQESIIVLLQKVRQPDFVLSASLKTFLFAIAKNLWLKRLRDNKLVPFDGIELLQTDSESFSIELIPEKTNDEKLSHWLTKITKNCQYILKALFLKNEPIDKVMRDLGWKNKHTAANQQYKCIQQVKKEKQKEDEA